MSEVDQFLVVAPQGRDAAVIEAQLEAAEIACTVATPRELVAAIHEGVVGAAIVTDDALTDAGLRATSEALATQPPWSDCPFIVLTPRSAVARSGPRAVAALGNVTVLESPMHPTALVSAARAALRARARQRRAQAYLAAREAAEEQVRDLAVTLEARVEARTSELMQAQASLEESLASYRYTIELGALIPWTASPEGQLIGIGNAWLDLTGATLDESLGFGWLRVVHPDDVASVFATWGDAVERIVPHDHEHRVQIRDGSYRWIRSRSAPRRAADGSVVRWYGTVEDIEDKHRARTQLQQLQADLIHVSRLSAMGAMGTTLAHELNQPLAAIANYVRGCRRLAQGIDPSIRDEFIDALAAADRSAVRAGEIVRRLRALVARGDVTRQAEDLPALINEACGIAMVDAATLGVVYRTRFDPHARTVVVDRIQIQQVVINLLRNALEALRDLELRNVLIETRRLPDGLCEVAVHDTGRGLDGEGHARLFTPFATSKAGGMGIGLSISRTIVEAHGGRIWYEPGLRGGAVFRFTIPGD
ncbi:sensor histidine kinase [Glacieibacterium frigidum]|uniref:histidine kinase n=1 Tax=Glacieibacterium frigidum TaxID=2593303 RepID=A0A552UER4_9SPHN|nr:ATP-binding protein [Glacieibacterium frigidum]TRW16669.1 PAS domain S-box protein [Glacieibacterium frigidum]